MNFEQPCTVHLALLACLAALAGPACGGDEPSPSAGQGGAAAGAASAQSGSGGSISGSQSGGAGTGGSAAATGGTGGSAPDLSHTVTVVDQNGLPQSDISLVVNEADGTFVEHLKTDALGQAVVDVPEGGSVSAFYGQDLHFQMRSVTDLPVGAPVEMTVYIYGDPVPPPSDAPTTYKFSICSTPPSTERVEIDGNCAGGFLGPASSSPLVIDNSNCLSDPSQDLIFSAMDGDRNTKGWATALGLSTLPNTTVTGQACMTNTTVHTAPFSLTGLHPSVNDLRFNIYTRVGKADQWNYTHPVPNAGAASSMRTVPNIPGAQYDMTVSASSGDNSVGSFFSYQLNQESQPIAVQLAMDDFGWVTAAPLNTADPERPSGTWITSKQPPADYTHVFMVWSTGAASFELNLGMAPDHAHSFNFPELPDELADFRPAATSLLRWGVIYEDWPNVTDYAEIVGGAKKEAVPGVADVGIGADNAM